MERRRIANIERLRGLAVLGVMLCHIVGQFYGVDRYSPGPQRLFGWAGQIGVALFFVVSGFCIRLPMARALAVDSAARLDVRRYLSHRARRILPPYWLAIPVSILAGALSPIGLLSGAHGLADVLLHVLGLHTLSPVAITSINGGFWTIGLELQFYLAYLLLANRRATPALGALVLAIGVLAYGAASWAFPAPSPWRQIGQELVPVTFWQWYVGAVLADAYVRRQAAFAVAPAALAWTMRIGAGLMCLLLGLGDPVLLHVHLTYWALPFAAAALVAAALAGPNRSDPNPAGRALGGLGRMSYSLYLLYPAVLALAVLAQRRAGLPPLACVMIAFAGAFLVGALGRRWIEQPFLAPKARPASSAGGLAAQPAE
jgi:peptidoglycan/LPS O-acetylase OafA/YrhL